MRVPSLIAASAVAFVITFAAATPAFAASPREDACTAAGGTLSANNQTCTVANGTGTVGANDITNVAVTCGPRT